MSQRSLPTSTPAQRVFKALIDPHDLQRRSARPNFTALTSVLLNQGSRQLREAFALAQVLPTDDIKAEVRELCRRELRNLVKIRYLVQLEPNGQFFKPLGSRHNELYRKLPDMPHSIYLMSGTKLLLRSAFPILFDLDTVLTLSLTRIKLRKPRAKIELRFDRLVGMPDQTVRDLSLEFFNQDCGFIRYAESTGPDRIKLAFCLGQFLRVFGCLPKAIDLKFVQNGVDIEWSAEF